MSYKITETVGGVVRTVEGDDPSEVIRVYNETFGEDYSIAEPVDEMLFDVSKLMRPPSIISPRYSYGEVT